MRKVGLAIRAIAAALANPIAFVRYALSFREYHLGRNFGWSGISRPTPHLGAVKVSPLEDFYLERPHRGMTKWRHYLTAFMPHFTEIRARGAAVRILEIGVFSGGSLQMYEAFFGDIPLEIVGVDIDPECRTFASDRVTIEIGDQQDPEFWQDIIARHPPFDIIIDDGGHTTEQQIASFENLFDHVRPGGLYVVEDVLSHTNRFAAFVSGLVAALNRRVDNERGTVQPTPLQQVLARVEVIPYAFLFRKHDLDAMPRELTSPWVGTSWTAAARRVFHAGNPGQDPPLREVGSGR